MCPTMILYLAVTTRTGPIRQLRIDRWPVVASGLCQLVSSTSFVLAVKTTSIANVVVIIAAAPVFAALISRVVIGERTSSRIWTAIAMSFVGISIVVSDSIGGGNVEGDLLAVLAIVAFAMNLTIWRRYPGQSRPLAMALAGFFIAMVAVIPADVLDLDASTFVLLFLKGVVTGPAGRVALASSTRYLGAAEVGMFAPVETVAATGWAWLAFDEVPSVAATVGGAIVLSALVYATRPAAKVSTVS